MSIRKAKGLCRLAPRWGLRPQTPIFIEGKAEGGTHATLNETQVCPPSPCLQKVPVQGGSPWRGSRGQSPLAF